MTQKARPLSTVNPPVIDDANLHVVTARQNFCDYVRSLIDNRHYIRAEARSGAFSSGRNTYLGRLWLILDPILQVSVYVVVFGLILQTSRGIDNFVGFLTLGVIFFRFLSRGITSGNDLVRRSRPTTSTFNLAAVSAVVSVTYKHFLDNLAPAFVAVALALMLQLEKPLTWALLLLPILYFLIHLFNFGAACLAAQATSAIPDLRSVINLVTRCLFFVSGVFFSVDKFDTVPALQQVIECNPIYQFLQSVRLIVLDGVSPDLDTWLYLVSWSLGISFVGFVTFWLSEERLKSGN